jgi:D-alanyl-D-alanine carboxypeptidase
VRGVDGIKTGYTRASGFNLVSSVIDRDRSIVAVVMGGRTGASRNAQMKKLIARYLAQGIDPRPRQPDRPRRTKRTLWQSQPWNCRRSARFPRMRHQASARMALAYAAPTPGPVIGREALAIRSCRTEGGHPDSCSCRCAATAGGRGQRGASTRSPPLQQTQWTAG